jgi:hypothetical protein
MKITVRPKKVKVKFIETTVEHAVYDCPTCGCTFKGFGPQRNVTRFKCECGQELIVT